MPERIDPKGMLRCPRCRSDVPVRELIASFREGNASAQDDSVNQDALTDHDNAVNTSSIDQKSAVERRRYYSRTRLPKNATPLKRPLRRRKPKTKVTSGDFVKVMLGGMLAFPVAQAILWWGFHRDPLSLGPKVASAVPFIVPRTLRGGEQEIRSIPSDYQVNPKSTLLQGTPFRFERNPSKTDSASSMKITAPIPSPAPMNDTGVFRPIGENNDKTTPPK